MPYEISRRSAVSPVFSIAFEHEHQFRAAESALNKIKSGPNGSRIIAEIERATTVEKQPMILVESDDNEESATVGYLTDSQLRRHNVRVHNHSDRTYGLAVSHYSSNGEGVRPVVHYNPRDSIMVDSMGDPFSVKNERMAFVTLAHELIHAYHQMKGTSIEGDIDKSPIEDDNHLREEMRAVGYATYANNQFSENGVRRDHQLPIRNEYFEFHERDELENG